MNKIFTLVALIAFIMPGQAQRNTPVPNNDFESWINYGDYSNPEFWDSPNEELEAIPFFGTSVVTKSSDHQSGSFSAKLETKEISLVGAIPGFITLGNLVIDVFAQTFIITGGAPVYDSPTHLKGYYKFIPAGGDSCLIGIGLFRYSNGVRDTVGYGYFSTFDTAAEWTQFSIWIDYDTVAAPDSMNIIAFSSAMEAPTPGSVLYVDNFYLDYTVGVPDENATGGIDVYQDRESRMLYLFFMFETPEMTKVSLYNMMGQRVSGLVPETLTTGRRSIGYGSLPGGVYILEVIHDNKRFIRKFIL